MAAGAGGGPLRRRALPGRPARWQRLQRAPGLHLDPPSSQLPQQQSEVAAAAAAEVQGAAAPAAQPEQRQPREQGPSQLRPPVALCSTTTLPAQPSLAAAVAALQAAVQALAAQHGGQPSGLVRLEVPVPRGTAPLWWLRGQAGAGATAGLLHPRIYFSPRRSTAAETEGSAAAGAAARGAGATAGAGAAWLWQGAPGQALSEGAVADMQRFLGAAGAQRVRAFGGGRFDAEQMPAPEWAEFGSFCFLIPRCGRVHCSSSRSDCAGLPQTRHPSLRQAGLGMARS